MTSYGPLPGAEPRPLSTARTAIADCLREQSEPLTLASLAMATGLHENTLREHLVGLQERGLVSRHRSEPSGRGRPAWLYQLTGEDHSEYAGLSAALAGAIMATSDDPGLMAAAAGDAWGRELARNRGATPISPRAAHHQVVHLIDDMGFGPDAEPNRPAQLRLTRCPLLAAAHRYPEVVCAVHRGLVQGALVEYGGDPAGVVLEAFAEPGACRLVVPLSSDQGGSAR